MMSSKILKLFIRVVLYAYHLYVNFKKKTYDQLNELIFQICRLNDSLNYCGVYYILIFGWLSHKLKKKLDAEIKIKGVKTKWRRLGELARDTETFSRDLEVILKIWRLENHYCWALGASLSPPSRRLNKGLEILTASF